MSSLQSERRGVPLIYFSHFSYSFIFTDLCSRNIIWIRIWQGATPSDRTFTSCRVNTHFLAFITLWALFITLTHPPPITCTCFERWNLFKRSGDDWWKWFFKMLNSISSPSWTWWENQFQINFRIIFINCEIIR